MTGFFFCYRPHRFSAETQDTIERANAIIEEMAALGYTLTLRQLYYQFVRRNWLAEQVERYGETRAVPQLSVDDHESIDPLSELAEKVPPDRIADRRE